MGMDPPQVEDSKRPDFLKGKIMGQIRKTLLVLAGLTMVLFMMPSCARQAASPKKPDDTAKVDPSAGSEKDQVQHKVLSFNLEGFTEKGEKKWDVNGKCAEAISATEVRIDDIVAKAYGDDAEATITADRGIYNKEKNNVRLEQNVKATIRNAGGIAEGPSSQPPNQSLSSDIAKETVKKKKDTVITCDGDVRFDYEDNVAYFNKNVTVVTEDGTIIADIITVYLNPETKKLKEIVAEGSVKILKEGNTIYSQKATYIEAQKKIILTGKPKIVISAEGGVETDFLGGTKLGGDAKTAQAGK